MKYFSKNKTKETVSSIGGKGYNLMRMDGMKMPVPKWEVVPQKVIASILDQKELSNEKALQLIDDYQFEASFTAEIKEAFGNTSDKLFAVRSSALQEDGVSASFAGQFATFLYVKAADIPAKIKAIWKSTLNDHVVTYYKENKLTHSFAIAVLVQEMIDPEVSGVAFGINPTSGNPEEHVICSVYGVGEGLVSGELDADTFIIEHKKIKSQEIANKVKQLGKNEKGGTIQADVPIPQQLVPSLSPEQLTLISEKLSQLGNEYQHPQDIEFAFANDQFYLLQTRPVTSTYPRGEKIIWDNSNIVESYPGVTTPLTFSYLLGGYKNVYLQLAQIMGAAEKTLQENTFVFSNMLGLINGRVYYNLLSWYKVLALFPGYSINARFMENMMGVKERFELPPNKNTNKLTAWLRVLVMLVQIAKNLFTIKKQTKTFLEKINEIIQDFKKTDLSKMSAYELMELHRSIDKALLMNWKAPLVNDSFAMVWFGKLQKIIEKNKLGENPNLHNDLMCGNSDIISVEPVHRSLKIATIVAHDEKLKHLFITEDASTIWKAFQEEGFHPELFQEVENYIEDFGDRCVGELKLETISYAQDPTLLIHMFKNLVVQGITVDSMKASVEMKIREEAEEEVKKSLKGKPFLAMKFNKTLKKARYFVSNRENLRYDRTRVFGMTRTLFMAIGNNFKKAGLLNDERDIFYLTMPEIFAFIEGTSICNKLKELTELRKVEYTAYSEMPTPTERIVTYGNVNEGNDFYQPFNEEVAAGDLKGIGCCPGIVKSRVQVIHHPSEVENLNGDILVTTSTDPGWVTLFPSASAIIVERGSLLSHSAIVSREMGIPCIVSVGGVLKRLKTGDVVEMDGRKGSIKIMSTDE
jgi:pyruvate,water dikinase